MTEALRDNNLDNTDAAIEKSAKKIDTLLGSIGGVHIVDTKHYVDSTLFTLSPISVEHHDEIKNLLHNKHRYTLEFAYTTVMERIEGDDGEYLGCMPQRHQSVAVRRVAFKKLPRPIICSAIIQSFLLTVLFSLFYLLYRVVLL